MPPPPFDYAARALRPPRTRPPIPGGPQTVADILDVWLERDPERLALVGRSGRFSYAELDRAVNRAAQALREHGVRPFDRVAACLPNDVGIVIAYLASMRLGALWVGINRPLAPPEKAYMLGDAGARVYLAGVEAAEEIAGERAKLPSLEHVITHSLHAGSGAAPRPDIEVDPFAPAAIAYTSGTTGFPKGAVHSQHNLLLPGAVARELASYPPELRQGVLLPLTILNLMVLSPTLALQLGSCCVCIDRIDALGIAEWVKNERVGHFAAVPTIYHDLLTHPEVKPADLASLRQPEVGGAECPEAFRALYRERFGAEVVVGYGMTEAPTAVTRSDGSAAPGPGLCGRAVPQVDILVLDPSGAPMPTGEVGEICVAPATTGPFAGVYTPMLGYWGKREATEQALRGDDVYRSGDLGFLDDRGDLYIRGRRNELILRGGANVYPAEVERALQEHPAVALCAVLGIPDERLGERVVAAVTLTGEAVEDELQEHCRARLARYKVPDRIAFVREMPRNAMGKIVKRELARHFEED